MPVELGNFIKLVECIGYPSIIFYIWYLYHKSTTIQLSEVIRQNASVTKELMDTLSYNTRLMEKLDQQMKTNMWCPVARRIIKGENFESNYNANKN